MSTVVRRAALSAALLALAACQLPDVTPFVDASMEVRAGVRAGGQAVADSLADIEQSERVRTYLKANKLPLQSREFSQQWERRVKACTSMIAYANSLQSIVHAAEQGTASAKSLADSVETLGKETGLLPLVPGGAPALALAKDAFATIMAQVDNIRALSALKETMSPADKAIGTMAGILQQDLSAADGELQLAMGVLLREIEFKYLKEIEYREGLENERNGLYSELSQKTVRELRLAKIAELLKPLADGSSEKADLLKEQQKLQAQLKSAPDQEKRVTELDALFKQTESWHAAYDQERSAALERLKTGRALISKCALTIVEWAGAHHQLTAAVQEGRNYSVESLLKTAGEIRDLVKRAQKL